ncbi:DNA-(apurinic or apyrimidinic site) endonuclease 2 [Silene latifolia]|uniref:DNA-(apurinic or apyrimidinic site) endonuclease 2 n=1 Tax=Silene latifolia TaxID=37657 RepID=UPI003D76D97D
MLKIVTYNVNGIRQRISQFGSLLKLLDSLDADIICFQEIKLTRQEVTADLIMAEGYESFFSCTRTFGKGRTGYSGVATFCRVKSAFSSTEVALPVAAEEGFTGLLENSRGEIKSRSVEVFADMECLEDFQRDELLKIDCEGRCVITDHGHFVLFNVYGPRADPDDVERVQFKADFYKIMQKRWELLQQEKRRIIVVGDLNIAPFAIDRCDAGPDFEKNEFRIWLRSMFLDSGGSFLDIFRQKHPERKDAFTHWSVHNGAEEFNFGSRIDHIIASGSCLHHVDDVEDHNRNHNLVTCHVHECDIMTEFKRWKPGTISRWKGGRATKLEGSDHVPVFVTLNDIPGTQLHSTPSLSARYIPEIRGSQQTIVSVLKKRKSTETLGISKVPRPATEEDTKTVLETLQPCTSSSVLLNDTDTCNYETLGSFKDTQDMGTAGNGWHKKKIKQNSKSQLSLTSFFRKVPISKESVGHSTKNASENPENMLNFQGNSKELLKDGNESKNIHESVLGQEENMVSDSGPENNKKNVALLEWQRIQQLMQDSIPLCEGHHEPCVARVVKKPGPNFGKRFYVCARAEGPSTNPETRCDFFRWAGSKSKQKK